MKCLQVHVAFLNIQQFNSLNLSSTSPKNFIINRLASFKEIKLKGHQQLNYTRE